VPRNASERAPASRPGPRTGPVARTAAKAVSAAAAGGRLLSIDAMRGLVIAAMIFMDHPASRTSVPQFLIDSPWSGLTFADLVFPSFLFIVGVSMAISFTRKAEAPTREVVLKFLWRIVALLLIGLAANWYRYGMPLRYTGVLQRIALASLIAFPFIRRPWKEKLLWAAGLIAVHSAVVLFLPGPSGVAGIAGGITPAQTVVGAIDKFLVGASHIYRSGFDPEGPFGLLTCGAQVLIGSVVGEQLIKRRDAARMPLELAAAGAAALLAGMLVSFILPVNKHLWTGTFVLVTCGLDTIILAGLFQVADRMGWRRGLEPLVPLGMNALAVYVGSILLAAWLAQHLVTLPSGTVMSAYALIASGFQASFGIRRGSYAFSAVGLTVWYAVAAALYQARVFIKL
jgi:predicted acyltransferase